jgi:hypothetical protein
VPGLPARGSGLQGRLRWTLIAGIFAAICWPASGLHAQQEPDRLAAPALEFHSGFWVNLHHFLYLQGRVRNDPAGGALQAYAASNATAGMTPAEQKTWNNAVAVYAREWSSRDLLHSGVMPLINNRLAELENCPEIIGKSASQCTSGLQGGMAAALNEAAPIYRARWWPEQDRENRAWIAALAPLLRTMGAKLGEQLAEVYQRSWPKGRYLVDVTWYAGPEGAYTSLDPVHVTIASHDPRNQGIGGLEMLLQGASYAVAQNVDETIAQDCRKAAKPIPRDLEPALLFYTTGDLLRRASSAAPGSGDAAAGASDASYELRTGLADHGWSEYQDMLERYWQAYLNGELSFDAAIARIVAIL